MSESKWIPVSERLPKSGQAVWFFKEGRDPDIWRDCESVIGTMPSWNYTHWMPAEIPAPPVIKSPAELAWEKRWPEVSANCIAHGYFLAGFEDGLSEGRKG